MAISAQLVWDAVQDVVKDVSDFSDASKLRGINYVNTQFREKLLEVEPARLISTATINQSTGLQQYALPTDFDKIVDDGCGLFIVVNGVQYDWRLPYTGFGSQQQGYYIEGDYLYLTPVPTNSETFTMKYIPLQTEITLLSQNLPSYLDFKYLENVKDALMVWYQYADQNLENEAVSDQRFVRALSVFAEKISRSPRVRPVFDISSNY